MAVLWIESDRPGAGKTAIAASLAAYLSRSGKSVGYIKPFLDPHIEDRDTIFVMREVLGSDSLEKQEVSSVAAELESTRKHLVEAVDSFSRENDVVLVEGISPQPTQTNTAVLPLKLDDLVQAKVIVVVNDEARLNADRMTEMVGTIGQRLLGVMVNSVTRYRFRQVAQELAPAMEAGGVKFLGALPEDRLLLAPTLGQLARHLDGQWVLGEEKAGELVEHFLIGGNVMDSGVDYFERKTGKAVIVRGDRPDIQLAALATPTSCLVLTGGQQPIQYVHYEAQQQDVPVLVVSGNTMAAAEALGGMINQATVHHLRKVDRFLELMRDHIDLDALLSSVSS